MTMRYFHPTPEHKIKAVLGLNILSFSTSGKEDTNNTAIVSIN